MFLALYQQKSTLRKQVKYVAADRMFQDSAGRVGQVLPGKRSATEGRGNHKDMMDKFAII